MQGINQTDRALRLDYYSLKKCASAAAGSGVRAPEFVEFPPGGMPASRPACLIEIEDPGGAKLRIRPSVLCMVKRCVITKIKGVHFDSPFSFSARP